VTSSTSSSAVPRRIRKLYADTSRGLIHVQESGTGPRVLLFINVTSWGAVLLDDVLPALADRGYRALNLDIMGYGRSDKREGDWTIEEFASNVEEAMDSIGAAPVGVIAGHMAGLVGAELAVRGAKPLRGAILDGMPVFDRARRAAFRAEPPAASLPWTEDGSHATEYWKRAYGLIRRTDPNFHLGANPSRKFREAFIAFLEVNCFEPNTLYAVCHYEIERKLGEISLPTLVMCGDHDWNLPSHSTVVSHVRGATEWRWPGVHPLHDLTVAGRSGEYVNVVDDFFAPLLG
jgi:pimeloyl-ACP methyl ester carboxylesterase